MRSEQLDIPSRHSKLRDRADKIYDWTVTEAKIQRRPVISLAIRPSEPSQLEKLQLALSALTCQDPDMRAESGPGDRETIVSGMGELHLEVICERILREYEIPLDIGEFKIVYLETIRKNAEAEGKYVRQIGFRGQFAHVKIRLVPRNAGSGYQFDNEIKDGAIPSEYVEPVNLGIQVAMKGGVVAGHEMVDLRAVLYDGSYHAGDSNEIAFRIAASMAFKEAARKAGPVVLEPVMSIELITPEEFAGAIVGDLSRRRGMIEAMEHRVDGQAIHAKVPQATMIGYAQHLRSFTQDRASYSMNFARYEEASRGGESGSDEAGVTAKQPRGPRAGSGFAAARWDQES